MATGAARTSAVSSTGPRPDGAASRRPWYSASPRLHILYWEAGQDNSVVLDGSPTGGGPTLCKTCRGVSKPWRFRLDNLQACVRSCGKEGALFRNEIQDFVCLSPRLAVRYLLTDFTTWLTDRGSKALTEEMVLGTPINVCSGRLSAEECGVSTKTLGGAEEQPWHGWFEDYVCELRAAADEDKGRLVAICLDRDGAELLALDVGPPVEPPQSGVKPVTQVLILLGGPSGITPLDQRKMETILHKKVHNLVQVKLPGGLQHSNVALTDLLMAHERRWLVPACEQLIRFGDKRYAEWRQSAQSLFRSLQEPGLTPDSAMAQLKAVEDTARRSRDRLTGTVSRRPLVAPSTSIHEPPKAAGLPVWEHPHGDQANGTRVCDLEDELAILRSQVATLQDQLEQQGGQQAQDEQVDHQSDGQQGVRQHDSEQPPQQPPQQAPQQPPEQPHIAAPHQSPRQSKQTLTSPPRYNPQLRPRMPAPNAAPANPASQDTDATEDPAQLAQVAQSKMPQMMPAPTMAAQATIATPVPKVAAPSSGPNTAAPSNAPSSAAPSMQAPMAAPTMPAMMAAPTMAAPTMPASALKETALPGGPSSAAPAMQPMMMMPPPSMAPQTGQTVMMEPMMQPMLTPVVGFSCPIMMTAVTVPANTDDNTANALNVDGHEVYDGTAEGRDCIEQKPEVYEHEHWADYTDEIDEEEEEVDDDHYHEEAEEEEEDDQTKTPTECQGCGEPVVPAGRDGMRSLYCDACYKFISNELNGNGEQAEEPQAQTLSATTASSSKASANGSKAYNCKGVDWFGASDGKGSGKYGGKWSASKLLSFRNGGVHLTHEQLMELVVSMKQQMSQSSTLRILDLHSTGLDDDGLAAVVKAIREKKPKVSTLMLHKNRLTNKAAFTLAALITDLPSPIEEIHLSHNSIDEDGARAMIKAAGSHESYPRRWDGVAVPLLIRLEHNEDLGSLQRLASTAEADVAAARKAAGLKVAGAGEQPLVCFCKKGVCNGRSCAYAKAGEPGPVVHLPFLNERDGKGGYKGYRDANAGGGGKDFKKGGRAATDGAKAGLKATPASAIGKGRGVAAPTAGKQAPTSPTRSLRASAPPRSSASDWPSL